eukprot:scaffold37945_cov40-Phaeocystis_antarctica.AAC.1
MTNLTTTATAATTTTTHISLVWRSSCHEAAILTMATLTMATLTMAHISLVSRSSCHAAADCAPTRAHAASRSSATWLGLG